MPLTRFPPGLQERNEQLCHPSSDLPAWKANSSTESKQRCKTSGDPQSLNLLHHLHASLLQSSTCAARHIQRVCVGFYAEAHHCTQSTLFVFTVI